VWKVQPSCAKTGDGIFEGLVSRQIIGDDANISSNGSAPTYKLLRNNISPD
jgi:hypothetical protein